MDRSTALSIFNIQEGVVDPEEVAEIYENRVFELRSYFLQNLPHPLVIQGRIRKLNTLEEAFCQLNARDYRETPLAVTEFSPVGSLLELIRWYAADLSRFKVELSNADTAPKAAAVLAVLGEVQNRWEQEFLQYTLNLEPFLEKAESIRFPDTAQMIKILRLHPEINPDNGENIPLWQSFLNERARIARMNKTSI